MSGRTRIPSFDCPTCGGIDADTYVWYASLEPNTQAAQELMAQPMPRKVAKVEDYMTIRDRARRSFRTDARLTAGSVLGVCPIRVSSTSETKQISDDNMGGLTAQKLADGIDFIEACTNWGGNAFTSSCAMVRSVETQQFCVNEALRESIMAICPTGVGFRLAGTCQ